MTTQPAARQGRTLVFVLAALLLLAGAVGAYLWWPSGPPAPPEIPLDSVEPEVARAVRGARAAVVKEPRAAATWGLLGRTLLANEMNTDLSLVCFLEAERLDPKDPRWPYFAAGDLLNLGKGAEALPKLRRAVELCEPGDARQLAARLWLAETLRTLGQFESAEDQLNKVLAVAPNEPRAHFGLGLLAYERGQWPACRAHLEKCVGSPQARKKACVLLATVCERLQDKQNADKYADLATRPLKDPGWADPFLAENARLALRKRDQTRIVEQLQAAGDFKQAAALATQMAADFPDDSSAHILAGRVLPRLGQYRRAEEHLHKARALAPDKIEVYYLLSMVYLEQGKVLQAQQGDRQKATRLFEESCKQARWVLARKPDYGFAHYALGLSLKHLQRSDEALAALRQAVHCNPEYADIHLALGEALAEAGKVREARYYLEQAALLAEPNDPRPQAALDKLPPRDDPKAKASGPRSVSSPGK